MTSKLSLWTVVIALSAANPGWAQHGDVEFGYESRAIVLENGLVYEADFGDLAGGPDATDEPGFGSEFDEGLGINADEIIGYNVTRPLVFHDGTDFAGTTALLTVENVGGSDVIVSSVTSSGRGLIGQADGTGDYHAHIDYTISSGAAVGAYGLYLTLSSLDSNQQPTGIADSTELLIVFNRGLDTATFESTVSVFGATIPEPAGILLAGLVGLAFALRRIRCR
jgi:hypothetical protein